MRAGFLDWVPAAASLALAGGCGDGEVRRVTEWVDLAAHEDVLRVIQQAGKRVYDAY